MWRKHAAVLAGSFAWGVAIVDALSTQLNLTPAASNLVLSVALVASGWLIAITRNRPVAAAYELGVEVGWRKGMLAANRDNVVPFGRKPIRDAAIDEEFELRLDRDA